MRDGNFAEINSNCATRSRAFVLSTKGISLSHREIYQSDIKTLISEVIKFYQSERRKMICRNRRMSRAYSSNFFSLDVRAQCD